MKEKALSKKNGSSEALGKGRCEGMENSEEWFRIIYECSPEALFVHEITGRMLDGNKAAERLLHCSRKNLIGKNFLELDLLPKDQIGKAAALLTKSALGKPTGPDEFTLKVHGSDPIIAEISTYPVKFNDKKLVLGVARDITLQRKAEAELLSAKQRMQRYLDIAGVMLVAIDRTGTIILVNKKGRRVLGFSESELLGKNWFETCIPEGQREEVRTVFQRLIAGEIDPVEYFENSILTKSGQERTIAWHNTVLEDESGTLTGTLSSGEDITERKRMQEELINNQASLKLSVESLINIVASTVEVRDPYTSGHQKRVAEIAVKIAEEMDLPSNVINGIRAAGMIHDIGKISIPAEILAKPSKLSDIERALMESHVLTGYEILKDIIFPWPVAEIVRQHHERMDGSGYPQGLKGDEILLEARIIAVADVLEAMSSHRPYRPALGIQMALGEIIKNRGVLFDAAVVDCLNNIADRSLLGLELWEKPLFYSDL